MLPGSQAGAFLSHLLTGKPEADGPTKLELESEHLNQLIEVSEQPWTPKVGDVEDRITELPRREFVDSVVRGALDRILRFHHDPPDVGSLGNASDDIDMGDARHIDGHADGRLSGNERRWFARLAVFDGVQRSALCVGLRR